MLREMGWGRGVEGEGDSGWLMGWMVVMMILILILTGGVFRGGDRIGLFRYLLSWLVG